MKSSISSLTVLLLASAMTIKTAHAADIPDAGRFLKESTPPPSLEPEKEAPTFQNPVLPKELAPGEAVVLVTGFAFIGNTLFSGDELSGLMMNCIGKEMTFAELNEATTAITTAYRKRGYFLASLFFPPQTVQPGAPITIEVSEGVLENIAVATKPEKTRTRKSLLQSYANQVPRERPLKEEALTAMVMKTNELPNISSRLLLEPGSRPGTTKATLEVTEGRPYSFSVDMDNYGNDATGEIHFGGTMELYSPLHLGDQLSLRLQTSTTGDLQNVQTGFTLPINASGTKVGISYNYVNYQLGGLFETLNAVGNGHNVTLSFSHPLFRQRDLIVNATIAGEGRLLDDRIANASSNQRRTLSCQAGLTGIQKDNILGGGSTLLSLGFIEGELDIDDSEALAIDQSSTGLNTNGRYSKLTLTLARSQNISDRLSLYTGAYGQWSNKNLNSSEQLALGGPGAVRAWQRGESYADRGFVATAELRYLFRSIGELPGKLEVTAFVDYGYAKLHSNPLPDSGNNCRKLTGAGIGMRWFDASNYSLQTTAAWKIAGESTPAETPMIFVQAIKRF